MKIKYLLLIIIYKNYNMNNNENNRITCLKNQLKGIKNLCTLIKNYFIEKKMNSNTSINNISETLIKESNGKNYIIISEEIT